MVTASSMYLILTFSAFLVGVILGWLSRGVPFARQSRELASLSEENRRLQAETTASSVRRAAAEEGAAAQRKRADRLEECRNQLTGEKQAAEVKAVAAETALAGERQQSAEKLALLGKAREDLSNQFNVLADKILEEKSRRFTEQNREQIGQLLSPLREKITEFQSRVEEVQKDGIVGRSELRAQIDNLKTLNERLSVDATNLVTALRGSSKVQGDWGEFILESLLEASGLRKGHEYSVQQSLRGENGKGARLDVIVKLPGGRHLVIDSKVSLGDYTDYCSQQETSRREKALGRHLASVRSHLKGLSGRNYQALYELRSLDFVVMFVPIEPAFMLAVANDPKLWNDGWDKNVLLVSPSTLLFVVRTVVHLWKQEHQTQNAREIANRGAELYDKFVGFVEDLRGVGSRLSQAQQSYDTALGKLSEGRGNLVRQAEKLKQLGVKPTKSLSPDMISAAVENSEEEFDGQFGGQLELAAWAEPAEENYSAETL